MNNNGQSGETPTEDHMTFGTRRLELNALLDEHDAQDCTSSRGSKTKARHALESGNGISDRHLEFTKKYIDAKNTNLMETGRAGKLNPWQILHFVRSFEYIWFRQRYGGSNSMAVLLGEFSSTN